MKYKVLLSIVIACSLLLPVFAQKRAIFRNSLPKTVAQKIDNSQVLPIKRVILYSNGVAYIERRGVISGNAEINLSFKQSQVDDVLKSMVVLDLGQGRIGAVSYNSSLPASARTAEIPFSVQAKTANDGGIAEVLSQLQGAKVSVTTNKGAVTGSILTVENRSNIVENNKPPVITHFLVIASESGEISNFDLGEVKSVKLLEEGTRKDISEFANATASTRRRDAKTITVTSQGGGQREMIVSYTISAPIWKTTYRVVLDEQGKPFFQGWAIVDNVSDEDWQNVQLSLVSGSPISFIQPLQNPLYRHRPVIEIPEDLSLEPQIYEVDPNATYGSGRGDGNTAGTGYGSGNRDIVKTESDDAPPVPKDRVTSVSELLVSENSGVLTAAKGEEFGDLFEYRIEEAVTIQRNRSALIPILQTKMEGERVSIYRENDKQDRPMSGVLLNNISNLTFESGSMTVLDNNAYAGEALMERLKPKETRLISFAVDLGTLVTVKNEQIREPAKLIKALNGTFQIHYYTNDKKNFTFANQTNRAKVIYYEHPIREKWSLSEETQKPIAITQNFYRFKIELQPFETKQFVVSEKQPLMDSYQLTALTYPDLELFLTRRYIDENTRLRLQKLIDLRSQINQINIKLVAFGDEEEKISEDQKRLRENIETLSKTPEAKTLISRYVEKVNQQETRLEQMQKERQDLQSQKQRLEGELASEIRNFELK